MYIFTLINQKRKMDSFLFLQVTLLLAFPQICYCDEVLTVRAALFKMLEGLELASFGEGLGALIFGLLVAGIVGNLYSETKKLVRLLQAMAARDGRIRRKSMY